LGFGRHKISLAGAIKQAGTRYAPGFPIHARIELSNNASGLALIVYTAKNAKAPPQANPVTESAGDPTEASWRPVTKTFGGRNGAVAEFALIARGAAMLTSMRRSKLSVYDVIRKASEYGTVYRIETLAVGGRRVFNVLVKGSDGKAQQLHIDMRIFAN
jgi:hypothetical protein